MFDNLSDALAHYEQSPTIAEQLPKHASKFGFTLEEVIGNCPVCGDVLIELRGVIADYGNCIELRAMGVCKRDNALVQMKPFRYYADGSSMWHDHQKGWVRSEPETGRMTRLWEWFKSLWG